jgi:hypothetical protein
MSVEKVFVVGVGDAVNLRVGCHDAARAGLSHGGFERGQEQGLKVARSNMRRRRVESALRDRMRGIVLGFRCGQNI